MGHALFAPSSAATWLECSYSARNSVPDPPKPLKTQIAADSGTRDHAFMEAAVTQHELPEDVDKREVVETGLDFLRQLEPGQTFIEYKGELTPECGGTTDYFRLPHDRELSRCWITNSGSGMLTRTTTNNC